MHSVSDVCTEANLSVDDLRLILADSRLDWADCTHITDAERQLILNSTQARLTGATGVPPVDSDLMPIDQQAQLVSNAAQVLGFPLQISAIQEIRLVQAHETVKNQVILGVVAEKRHQLEQELARLDGDRQAAFLESIAAIAEMMPKVNNDVAARLQESHKSTHQRLEAIMGNLGK